MSCSCRRSSPFPDGCVRKECLHCGKDAAYLTAPLPPRDQKKWRDAQVPLVRVGTEEVGLINPTLGNNRESVFFLNSASALLAVPSRRNPNPYSRDQTKFQLGEGPILNFALVNEAEIATGSSQSGIGGSADQSNASASMQSTHGATSTAQTTTSASESSATARLFAQSASGSSDLKTAVNETASQALLSSTFDNNKLNATITLNTSFPEDQAQSSLNLTTSNTILDKEIIGQHFAMTSVDEFGMQSGEAGFSASIGENLATASTIVEYEIPSVHLAAKMQTQADPNSFLDLTFNTTAEDKVISVARLGANGDKNGSSPAVSWLSTELCLSGIGFSLQATAQSEVAPFKLCSVCSENEGEDIAIGAPGTVGVVAPKIELNGECVGFFGKQPAPQQGSGGPYTLDDVVAALQNYGLLKS